MRLPLESVLGRRIRELAKQRGIPLTHVADRSGLAHGHFWLILDGEISTSLGNVQKIAKVFDVPPVVLLVPDGGDAFTEHDSWLGLSAEAPVRGTLAPNPRPAPDRRKKKAIK